RSLCRRPRRQVPGGPGLDPERFRVFAVACARRVWDYLTANLRIVLQHLERYPHDTEPDLLQLAWQVFEKEIELLHAQWSSELAQILGGGADYRRMVEIDIQRDAACAAGYAVMTRPYQAAGQHTWAARAVRLREFLDRYPLPGRVPSTNKVWTQTSAKELRAQADLLRDVFGNPYHPVAFEADWR